MDNQQGLVRTGCEIFLWIQECFIIYWIVCIVFWIYECELLYIIFIQSLCVVNFNVSSTKDNSHAKLSRYVYCGRYIWYQSKSIQIVPWVIKFQPM